MPIAVCLAWARRNSRADLVTAIRWGLVAAVPATLAAGYLFQRSVLQARWEALLASAAAALALTFGLSLWRRTGFESAPRQPDRRRLAVPVRLGGAPIVVRQTMGSTWSSSPQFSRCDRSTPPSPSAAVPWSRSHWQGAGRPAAAGSLPTPRNATSTFTGLFLAQARCMRFTNRRKPACCRGARSSMRRPNRTDPTACRPGRQRSAGGSADRDGRRDAAAGEIERSVFERREMVVWRVARRAGDRRRAGPRWAGAHQGGERLTHDPE